MVCIQKKSKFKMDGSTLSFPDVYIEPHSYKFWKKNVHFISVNIKNLKDHNASQFASEFSHWCRFYFPKSISPLCPIRSAFLSKLTLNQISERKSLKINPWCRHYKVVKVVACKWLQCWCSFQKLSNITWPLSEWRTW